MKRGDNINKTIGIARSLLYYYYKDLWQVFFQELGYKIIISSVSNKEILSYGEKIAPDEACLSLKLFLGHINDIKDKCDYILVPRIFSLKVGEQACTNFNSLYDIVNNLFDINILNYNIDLYQKKDEVLGFLSLGEELGVPYVKTYKAYKKAKEVSLERRREKEAFQKKELTNENIKILLAGHPYNLYDNLVGDVVSKYLKDNNVTVIYSDRIDRDLIDEECYKLSTDMNWTYSKEVMASINYYQDKVDGIILISSFPCGPDSLANELVSRKIKNIPIISLLFEDSNSTVGVVTRLESFIDILNNVRRKSYEKSN